MKVLVTGALGHIGSLLIRDLPEHIHCSEMIMVDNMATQRYCSLFNLPQKTSYTFIESDVKNVKWDDVLVSVDVVIHLAATTDAAGTADKPELVHENNHESTKILADACLRARIPLIFPSSTSVYGSQKSLVDESSENLAPQSPYAHCKIKEEELLASLFANGLKGVICRFGTIYGASPGMRFHTAVNKFCWQATMDQPLTVWKTALNQKRPYLDLTDSIRAIAWIIENKIYDGQTFNILTNNLTVQNIIDEIKKHCPALVVNKVEHKIMNQLSYEVSTDRFLKTGFKFNGQIEKAIEETIQLLSHRGHR